MFLPGAFFLLTNCSQPEPTIEESLDRANNNLEAGKIDQAIILLESLNDKKADDPAILEALAFAYIQRKDNIFAAYYFSKLAEVDARQSQFFIYAAKSFLEGGDIRGSAHTYRRYLAVFPHDQLVWKSLGNIYEELNDPNNAIEAYLHSYHLKPDGRIATHLGRLFHGAGNLIQAQNWYQAGLEFKQEIKGESLLGLMKIALEQKRFSMAEKWLQQIDTEFPNLLDTSSLSYARADLNNWRESQDDLKVSLAEQSRLTQELREQSFRLEEPIVAEISNSAPLGELIADNGNEDDTTPSDSPEEPLFEDTPPISDDTAPTVIEEDNTRMVAEILTEPPPPTPHSLLKMARELKSSGNYKKSIVTYRQSLALNDGQASIWNELSEALELDGQLAYAEAASNEAIRRDSHNIIYTLQLLNILEQGENVYRYLKVLQDAKNNFPYNPDITLSLARCNSNIVKNMQNAIILYEEFLRLAPDHPQWQVAKTELESLSGTP